MVSDLAKKFKRKPDFLCKKVQTFCVPAPFRFPRRQKPRVRLPKEPLGPVSRPGHALRRPAPGSRLGKSTAVPTFRAPRTTPPAALPPGPRRHRPPGTPAPSAVQTTPKAASTSLQAPTRDLAARKTALPGKSSRHQSAACIRKHKHVPKNAVPQRHAQAIPTPDRAATDHPDPCAVRRANHAKGRQHFLASSDA